MEKWVLATYTTASTGEWIIGVTAALLTESMDCDFGHQGRAAQLCWPLE